MTFGTDAARSATCTQTRGPMARAPAHCNRATSPYLGERSPGQSQAVGVLTLRAADPPPPSVAAPGSLAGPLVTTNVPTGLVILNWIRHLTWLSYGTGPLTFSRRCHLGRL